MKDKILKLCEDHNWSLVGKTSKGWTVQDNKLSGHVITSPTLGGLYRCMLKWL